MRWRRRIALFGILGASFVAGAAYQQNHRQARSAVLGGLRSADRTVIGQDALRKARGAGLVSDMARLRDDAAMRLHEARATAQSLREAALVRSPTDNRDSEPHNAFSDMMRGLDATRLPPRAAAEGATAARGHGALVHEADPGHP